MPMRNLITIIGAVGVGVWAYFGVIERLNQLETSKEIMLKDIESQVERIDNDVKGLVDGDIAQNNEFRIKWPRGDLGSPPADSEQYMLIEFLSGQVEDLQDQLESMMNNKVNITRLQTDMEKALVDIEELKDKLREVIEECLDSCTENDMEVICETLKKIGFEIKEVQ